MKKIILFLFIIGVLFICCEKDQKFCGDTTATYNGAIKNIIEESCNNGDCHAGSNGGWLVLPGFATYNNLSPYLNNGQIENRINTLDSILRMPPLSREDRQISDSDLEILNAWICNGFPEE